MREGQENEKEEDREKGKQSRRGREAERAGARQTEDEEVGCIQTDLLTSFIKRKRMDEGCRGYRLTV